MTKKYLLIALLVMISPLNGQIISSSKWKDMFSYNNVFNIQESENQIIAATSSGLFYYDTSSGEITKLSKANGLHEVGISAFDYNAETQIGLIGYQSGAMDIITSNGVIYVVDIPIAQGFNGDKQVNHIFISGSQAVISVDYGVSIFNLSTQEFGQTAFFNDNGTYIAANEAIIKDDEVYVATNNGLKKHTMNVTFPVFTTWENAANGNIKHIDYEDKIAYATTSQAFYENGSSFSILSHSFSGIADVVTHNGKIIITDENNAYTFSNTGGLTNTFPLEEVCNTANEINSNIYLGTVLSGVKDTQNNAFKPDGPYNNASYKMSLLDEQIWVSTGGRNSFNTPIYRDLGYYHFDGEKWNYPDYFVDNDINFNVMDVIPNPSNPSEVFFANYSFIAGEKGIYKMLDNEFVKVYKNNDSGRYYNRAIGFAYDDNNVLYASVSAIENNPLDMGYYWYDESADDFNLVPYASVRDVQKPFIKDDIIYTPAANNSYGGMVMKALTTPSDANTNLKVLQMVNNLPINGTVSAAMDNNDILWIGTRVGLRILQDPTSAITDIEPQTESIIIEQNGIAEELFRDSNILQIAVDTANRKWISVDGGGVYYLDAYGENTLLHFTKENSPLPDNSVTDIQIDDKTGKVYFVTLNGIVVYQSDIADVSNNFGDVMVYPNPVVKKRNHDKVTIKGLAAKANIRIVDTAGNLVHQAVALGGVHEWNLMNTKGQRVASGIYFVLMTNKDATDTATAKIAIVN